MKIHINSLSPILQKFLEQEVFPQHATLLRSNGESEISVTAKSFMYTLSAKLFLKNNVIERMPQLKLITDKDGYIDLDEIKSVTLETIMDFKSKNKPIVIPQINWELDEEDINKIFEIAREYEVKE
ncbi:TPA: hypothetical protein R8I08_001678 [Campylobacter jejuni]|nr:hypothetical protein [Campylobacter jejuni]